MWSRCSVSGRGVSPMGWSWWRAAELGRVLVTQNVNDFKAVHTAFINQGRPHPGIIGLPQRGALQRRALRAAMLLEWIGTQAHASRLFVWGELQRLLAGGYGLAGYTNEEVDQVLGRA